MSYKYFTAGWVVDHNWNIYKDVCLTAGKVKSKLFCISTALMGHHQKQWRDMLSWSCSALMDGWNIMQMGEMKERR